MTKNSKGTPIRRALKANSTLHEKVHDGIGAVLRSHRKYLSEDLREAFADSIDLDEAMREGHEEENRWDYLLGHTNSDAVVGVEPHSAKQDQISTIIKKRTAALEQLRSHLKPGATVREWLWVASKTVQFADTEKARLRLDQAGIQFVGNKVLPKHLKKLPENPKDRPKRRAQRRR